jgi:hypothetical protein
MKKTRGKKSRATVPLRCLLNSSMGHQIGPKQLFSWFAPSCQIKKWDWLNDFATLLKLTAFYHGLPQTDIDDIDIKKNSSGGGMIHTFGLGKNVDYFYFVNNNKKLYMN